MQHQRQAFVFGQAVEFMAHARGVFVGTGLRIGLGVLAGGVGPGAVFHAAPPFARAGAQKLQGGGAGRAAQPVARGPFGVGTCAAELPRAVAQLEQGLLHRVLGQALVAQDAAAGAQEFGAMLFEQCAPSRGIAADCQPPQNLGGGHAAGLRGGTGLGM